MELNFTTINVTSVMNQSGVITDIFDFKVTETQQFVFYKVVAYIFGIVIFLSNLTVVISSGLILKKGQQPKSTYLLLGNVSLADTIVGVSILFSASTKDFNSSSPLCIFQIGMLVCPAMVSIFSVGLIAVDRYIYILHGLYYQRWFNTTKVRMGIVCIWIIGITLGFLPASGWVNTELEHSRCYYVSLFPGSLILLNSLLSIVPIILVAVLYSIILVRAVKNVKEINATKKPAGTNASIKPELRINRGNTNIRKTAHSVKIPIKNDHGYIRRSASFSGSCNTPTKNSNIFFLSSQSNNHLNNKTVNISELIKSAKSVRNTCNSNVSIQTICSTIPDENDFTCHKRESRRNETRNIDNENQRNKTKVKEANKWRAIIVVMLTSGSFIVTWMPFFITVIFFVFCQEKLTNPQCLHLRIMLSGPVATLAFFNSILNPLIYAWWHKGFQKSIKTYFRRYLLRFFQKDVSR